MSTWYMITTVPVGTYAWVAELGAFQALNMYEQGEAYERFGRLQERHSDWVGGATSTPKLYEALTGEALPGSIRARFWEWVGEPDPYRLALIGGDLWVPFYSSRFIETSFRLSTTEEAAEALRVMERIAARLDGGEEALQPFAGNIHAYLDFYRSVKLGEEELVYGHT
jgi:hypothetical protein